jgi:hypothetical protein
MLRTLTELVRKAALIRSLTGIVKTDNLGSVRAFERSGFELTASKEIKGLQCYEFQFHLK